MRQQSLFPAGPAAAEHVVARIAPTFDAWRQHARYLLQAGVAPARVWWQPDPDAPTHFASGLPARVPKAYIQLARLASYHRAADRWALLYSVLWRLTHGEGHVLEMSADPQVVRLRDYAKSIRRDAHKMKAFVRFREIVNPAETEAPPRFVAWFEPDHPIVELVAGFFQRRFANMCWSILTPERCAHWEGGGAVWFTGGVDRSAAPAHDGFEEFWRTYYRSIFNPARLKVAAMLAEMPQKYWRNLPEAHTIPALIREANQRCTQMLARPGGAGQLRCGPRPPSVQQRSNASRGVEPRGSLQALAHDAMQCRRCPLWQSATQTVFGEGPVDARIVLVGEQPGDHEDLRGQPFVGPAGTLLDRALEQAGLDRSRLYLTNAVKHFRFIPRGKRRIHSKPSAEHIQACAQWLEQELEQIDPALIVCLGATAAHAVLGQPVQIARTRGQLVAAAGRRVLVTVHPAYVLRVSGPAAADREFAAFVADLRVAASCDDVAAARSRRALSDSRGTDAG